MATINGSQLSGDLTGTALADIMKGFGGKDTILGLEGNDLIVGGNGLISIETNDDDVLRGGNGDDVLLRLAYRFHHAEARRAFRKAQRIDPNCAMCYWGEALVPNSNAPMDADATAPAMVAVTRARELAATARPHEQALIEALSQRYAPDPGTDRRALDSAY